MAVAAIAALSSCTNDDIVSNENGKGDNNANAPVFTATIEGEAQTRTTLGLNSETGKYTKVNWENADEVSVNGIVYTVAPGSDATTATLAKKNSGDASPTATFKAIYPASLYNNGTYELPATQTYAAGQFNAPMYAENSETSLAFKNICAVLAVTVPSGTVKKIKVVSDKRMHGAFTVTSEGVLSFTSTEELDNDDRTVTLNCGETGVSASNTTFYIAIPAQTYAYLNIYLSADGTTYKEAMATRKPAGLGTLARNTIYPINYVRNAVQLCENGPYFAEFNVGSTITSYANVDYHGFATDDRSSIFGGLYCWGCKEDIRSSYPTNLFQVANLQGRLELPDEYDVASASWGANWKIPSKNDIHLLFTGIINDIDNGGGSTHFDVSASNSGNITKSGNYVDWNFCDGTTVKYVDSCTLPGYKITGNQAGYTGNSIFLPYTGRRLCVSGTIDCNKAGYYWLSSCYPTPNNNSVSPYYLSFVYEHNYLGSGNNRYTFTCTTFQNAFTQNQWEAYAVRPVLR